MRKTSDIVGAEDRTRKQKFLDFSVLYLSKTGALVITLFIIPHFQKLMSAEDFGFVALFLSVQALLLVLDLGLSLSVGRDVAVSRTSSGRALFTWRAAEYAISLAYIPLFIVAVIAAGTGMLSFGMGTIVLALGAIWQLTLQNIGYSALIARRDFVSAAGILVTGTVMRGGLTLAALEFIAPTLQVFLISQASAALIQYLATRFRCQKVLERGLTAQAARAPGLSAVSNLLWRARSLSLFGLAGAAVLQGDKLIISALDSAVGMAPYYLATTLCLVPISSLAGPVASYFQPEILRAISKRDPDATQRSVSRMMQLLAIVTVPPTMGIWLLRDPIIQFWLVGSENAALVTEYTAILLPGVCVGAFGFIPYVILLGKGDLKFQARLSTIMTIVTLAMTAVFAYYSNTKAICWVYSSYHASSTILSWLRWLALDRYDVTSVAKRVGLRVVVLMGGAASAVSLIVVVLQTVPE